MDMSVRCCPSRRRSGAREARWRSQRGGPAAAAARSVGFELLEVAGAPPGLREPWFARARREPEGNVNSHVVREVFTGMDAQAALPEVLAACRGWRPDVLVHESCEFAAVLAAELSELPRVRVAIRTTVTERVILGAAAAPLAARRVEVGLPPASNGARRLIAPSLTLAPAPLEDAGVAQLAGSRRFRVPAPAPRPLPDWWPGDARPLVYLTFETVAPGSDLFPELHRTATR